MATNDPKDPATWTPEMVAALNAVHPTEAQRMMREQARCDVRSQLVSYSPDYKSEQPPGVREAMAVYNLATVNASRLAALEAVARAAADLDFAHSESCRLKMKHRHRADGSLWPCTCGMEALTQALAKLREVG